MISDTLAQAVDEVDAYLNDCAHVYGAPGSPLYDRITTLRDDMNAVRTWLDGGVDPDEVTEPSDKARMAEAAADVFLVGMPEDDVRGLSIARNAYVCGWLHGSATAERENAE